MERSPENNTMHTEWQARLSRSVLHRGPLNVDATWAESMSQKQSIDLRQIASMEVLQMSIAELSAKLESLALNCSKISFTGNCNGEVSHDATVFSAGNGYILEITEPATGTARFESVSKQEIADEQYLRWFVESIDTRRLLLYQLTEQLMELLPDIPTRGAYSKLNMFDFAKKCDLPVTTVSRLVGSKKLNTPSGSVLYCDLFTQNDEPSETKSHT